jgi:phosphate transport system substrate-binding protein
MKKITALLLSIFTAGILFTGCAGSNFDPSKEITVVSREDGSGTRGAFIELMKIEETDTNGNKTDKTTKDALIASKTDVMLTTVSGDPMAIGYVSTGSLSDAVKAVKID